MRVELDICGGGASSLRARSRLSFVLARFAATLVTAALRVVAVGPGRVQLSARVILAGGEVVALVAEDEASDAALQHFVDRLGRAVARRAGAGGRHG